jgi:thiamine biosynthesis lipoprotein
MTPLSKSNPKPGPKDSLLNFEAIGTQWTIELFGQEHVPQTLVRAITSRIGAFDKHYSRFRDDSLVTAMADKAGDYDLPPDAKPMFDLYWDLYKITGGALTPLIGQTLADAGYDAQYSLQPKRLKRPPAWDDALDYNFPHLQVKHPVLLDFGACGKGYLVDIIAGLLSAHGITSFLVNAGGDMVHRGDASVLVGLEHPDNPSLAIGTMQLQDASLCGSAGNRRAWADYHHILDPQKLTSPAHIRAVWVYAESTMLADALTTALYFVSPETLGAHYRFEYAIIHDDYALTYSDNFPATFFNESDAS